MPRFVISDGAEPTPSTEQNARFVISEQPSIGKLGQFAAGAASYATWPADVFKASTRASARDVLAEMGEESPEAFQAVEESVGKIPTQESLENYLEQKSGVRFKPQGFGEETARTAGQLLSPKGITKGIGTIAKRAGAAVGGAIAQKGLEGMGVNPIVASLVGITGASLGDLEKRLSQQGAELRNMAEKHGLTQYPFMSREKEILKPVITKTKATKIREELGSTSKAAIERVIKSKNPMADLRSNGVDINKYSNDLLNKTEELAKQSKTPVSLGSIVDTIDKKIQEVRSTAPSLSDVDKKFIEILEEKKNDFSKSPSVSLEQYLNQYRKNNVDRKAFYKNPQMTHLQEAANSAYGFLNENMVKNLAHLPDKEFAKTFEAGNKIFQEKSNLLQAEHILNPFFEDPTANNLQRILKNEKKMAFLKRNLGEEGVKDINEIGKYIASAQQKLGENLVEHGENFVDLAKAFGITSLSSLVNPNVAAMLDIGILSSYVKGLVLTNKNLRHDYLNLAKAMSSGNAKAIRTYSSQLNEDFENEYGDPEELLANQEDIL